jgi:hypothetical protein
MKNNFIRRNDVSQQSSSLIKALPGVTNERIAELFGPLPDCTNIGEKYFESIVLIHKDEPYRESEKFFDSEATGIYCLYTSFGVWRIGGFSSNKHINELEQLIRNK